jgi:hypothetical protein
MKKGAIQVDSPPFFLTRPVGGKPSRVALMYFVEHRFRKKVAEPIQKFRGRHGLFHFA